MLTESLDSHFTQFYHSLKALNLYLLLIIVLSLWLVWRLWTFTIVPRLRPHSPLVLPYALPVIDHTLSWRWDRSRLLDDGNKYFPGNDPFALYIGGKLVIVVRNPDSIKAIWNDPKSFTFDEYMKGIVQGLGILPSHYNLAFIDNPAKLWKGDENAAPQFVKENPAKRRLVSLQENWMKDALQPGAKMQAVSEIIMGDIPKLIPAYLSDPRIVVAGSKDNSQLINIFKWGRYVLGEAGTKAFLGPEILTIDPDFVQHYFNWEDLSWKIPYGHPRFLSKDLAQAQEVLVQTLMKYFALDPARRPNLTWLFDVIQSNQRKIGLTAHDVGSTAIVMLWGVHLNPPRLLFWLLAHILCSESLTERIRNETNLAFNSTTNSFSIHHLMTTCPILTAAWHEALRLYTSSSVVRTCESPATIGDKTINVGDRLIGPFAFVHRSKVIWGDDADEFDEQRWLQDGPTPIKTPKGFYPFGGGHMHCPGRFLAKQEVFLFVATLLREYEIEPVSESIEGIGKGGGRWKVPDVPGEHAGAAGISNPNEEFLVRVTKSQI